jgi:hypothetical protein
VCAADGSESGGVDVRQAHADEALLIACMRPCPAVADDHGSRHSSRNAGRSANTCASRRDVLERREQLPVEQPPIVLPGPRLQVAVAQPSLGVHAEREPPAGDVGPLPRWRGWRANARGGITFVPAGEDLSLTDRAVGTLATDDRRSDAHRVHRAFEAQTSRALTLAASASARPIRISPGFVASSDRPWPSPQDLR